MAVKTSGQLSLRYDILAEVGGASFVNLSLRNMSSRAGFSTPDAMSEFYGYSNAPAVFPQVLGYDAGSMDRACVNIYSGRGVRRTSDTEEFDAASRLYNDIGGTTFATAGWYATDFSNAVRYWNGSSFTSNRFCRI